MRNYPNIRQLFRGSLPPIRKTMMMAVVLLVFANIQAAEPFVNFAKGDWLLNKNNVINICVDNNDQRGISIAVDNLRNDLKKVCGAEVRLSEMSEADIVVGSLGHSKPLEQLAKGKNIDLTPLKGKSETYLIAVADQRLVIAGSDRRGTIFGIYELSRQIGVSPWYYWADVPIAHHDNIFINKGVFTDGQPAVKYRGIFLNDEAPCLTSWVKNTFGTEYGGHEFYAKVFELILRLKGNFLWPAMWGWAFYADDPENSRVADEMGVVIGTSHHEPMARNHQEYARKRQQWGAWNYRTNKQQLDRFFREGIERMKGTDDVVTIGMRGDGDEAMSAEADTRLLEEVVKNQRRIIEEVTHKPAKETPQVWALYKEVMDYYDAGMKVPDDVIFLLCDDNWGNVRRVPLTDKEKKHKGGWGLYYHVDYVGAPRNSKWLNVTPAQNMWEQLSLASQYGIDKMWILNVGDLKPMEYPIQLFMDMAWNPSVCNITNVSSGGDKSLNVADIREHERAFCQACFGEQQAAQAASLLDRVSKLNGRCTAEMLDHTTYTLDEWPQVVADYTQMEAEALEQFSSLRADQRDAYRQIILFPIQAMANIYRLYQAVAMNRHLAKMGNPECNVWADKAEQAFKRDSLLSAYYNHQMANGKWKGMMTQKHIGYRSWNDDFAPHDVMPHVTRMADNVGNNLFEETSGAVIIEAEHFHSQQNADGLQWTLIPGMGRTLSGLSLQPYTTPVPQQGGPRLEYKFNTNHPVKNVYVVVKSTLDFQNKGGHRFRVTIDDQPPYECNFNRLLNEQPDNIYSIYYPTVARRVVANAIPLQAPAGTHTLTIEPLDPAIVFEKIVVDCGGYKPHPYLFGKESMRKKE